MIWFDSEFVESQPIQTKIHVFLPCGSDSLEAQNQIKSHYEHTHTYKYSITHSRSFINGEYNTFNLPTHIH